MIEKTTIKQKIKNHKFLYFLFSAGVIFIMCYAFLMDSFWGWDNIYFTKFVFEFFLAVLILLIINVRALEIKRLIKKQNEEDY